MVAALHAAGIEVILDIVPNHTAEGGVGGTTLCYRGLDAPSYYSLGGNGHDNDITGCGNTLDSGSPTVIRLVCDAMRHWVTVYGVDGFRIDLASVLGRPHSGSFDPNAPLLTAIAVDPVLSRVKLIAEPWDATGEGYRVGGFGVAWSEWNGRFRDAVRDFWRGPRRHRRSRLPAHRQLRPVRHLRAAAVGVGQLRHRARRVHPARPRLLRAQAQRGQRRGQPRRHRRQPLAELRRGGRDGVAGDRGAAARHGPRAARHAAALHGHADAAGRRRAVAHPGRQQQRLLPRRRTSWVDWAAPPEAESLTAFVGAADRRSAAPRPTCSATASTATARCCGGTRPGGGSAATTGTTASLRTLGLLRGDWLLLLHAGGDPMPYVLPPDGPFVPGARLHLARRHARRRARPLAGGESVLLAARSLLLLRTP